MSFTLQTQDDISPTLGSEQLQARPARRPHRPAAGHHLLAASSTALLGLVTVASLVVAAVLTYGVLTFLGWAYNFRLTLAGVTGLIVAIGVTADSFIVYFERIRDEVREGRPLAAAVEAGWDRARRTILAADAVNFLAAAVLYVLAASNVRGFAFTLGLTTLIDLARRLPLHPPGRGAARAYQVLRQRPQVVRPRPERLGAKTRYVGRGQFARPTPSSSAKTRRDRVDDVRARRRQQGKA